MILSYKKLSVLWNAVPDEKKPEYTRGYGICRAYQVADEPNIYLVYLDGFYHPGAPFFPPVGDCR